MGHNLKNNIIPCNVNFEDFLPPPLTQSIFINPTNSFEVDRIIKSLKINKGNICKPNNKMFKLSSSYISYPISCIFNCIIKTGNYPKCLKVACVTPLFKSGNKDNVSSYRPISCLPSLKIVIEKLLHCRLVDFLNVNNILCKEQFGFRSGLGKMDAVTNLLDHIYESMNSEKYFGAVSLDLSKAFDTVDHSILLKKLSHYGMRGTAFSLLESYLKDRYQYVSVNGFVSDQLPVTLGVPQGSVLGPLLFLLYVNDIPLVPKKSLVTIYADDIILYFSDFNVFNLCDTLSKDLEYLEKWLRCNCLTLNYDKTSYTMFTYKSIPNNINIKINNFYVKRLPSLNFLGMVLDQKLTFNKQILKIVSHLSKVQGIIFKLNFLPAHILRSLYMSLFQPHLVYCIETWGCSCLSILDPLIILQKKVVRVINGSGYLDHTAPIFNDLKILKIKDLFDYFISIYSFKVFKQLKYNELFTKICELQISHGHNLRSDKLRLPSVDIYKFKQSIIYQVVSKWNEIPNDLKRVNSLPGFKRKYKSFLLDKYNT